MPKINLSDVDMLIEQSDDIEYEDRREIIRYKTAKSRFKENREMKENE